MKLVAAMSRSDDEMDDIDDGDVPDAIPARAPKKAALASKDEQSDDEAVEEEDGDEDGEDEYQVEKILTHQYDQAGNVLYQIKWLGYEAEADMTWEPIDNLYVRHLSLFWYKCD
jgi:chromobox protein 1